VRVVIDPNVLVSAAVASGASAQLIDRWLTERPFEIVVCPMLLAELQEVLARPKFRQWIGESEARSYVERLRGEAETRPDPLDIPSVTRDPKDDYLVALAREAGADSLVSGDPDLTSLADTVLRVMTPRELLDLL
jgi:hypothetical protein